MQRLFLLAFAAATLSAQNAPSTFTPNKGPLKFARDTNKQEEILIRLEKLEEQNRRILKILEEADAPTPPVKVDVSNSPALGMDKAPITIVEFTDFQCPYCSKFHTETFPQLHDKFIASGLVRFISRDLPLPMHKNALQAAEAARCAEDQGHFWEMRDWMQSNPTKLELADLTTHAQEIDLDLDQYQDCMAMGKHRAAVEADAADAQAMHITGTPAFVIGKSGATVEGQLITGAQPLATFEKAILALK